MNPFPGDLGSGVRLTNQVSIGAPPDRRERSLRRTTAMHCYWPKGPTGALMITGTGRDLYTDRDVAAPRVWAEDRIDVMMRADRRIGTIEGSRRSEELAGFAGLRPSGELRQAMARTIPDEVASSSILSHLLDELVGTNFMAMGAWFKWLPGGIEEYERLARMPSMLARNVEGVCISFQAGSPSITEGGQTNEDLADHPAGHDPAYVEVS